MKASHTDQLDLLELQKLDQKESALRHKRDSHPAHATVREFAGRVADLQRAAELRYGEIPELERELAPDLIGLGRYLGLGAQRVVDLARALERALRRSRVPMAYSAGFTPHPKISYVGAAPTGAWQRVISSPA